MSKYHDDRTAASDPVLISISDAKLRPLQPELYGWRSRWRKLPYFGQLIKAAILREVIGENMQFGDSRAALVIHSAPLVVAAYTDEQDAVVLLQFPAKLASDYRLEKGAKLLTVNTYFRGDRLAHDIVLGSESTGRYANYYPIIAEIVSDDEDVIARRKRSITTSEWQRTERLARAALAKQQIYVRDGRPLFSHLPGRIIDRASRSGERAQ
jgi:hypothetical protein